MKVKGSRAEVQDQLGRSNSYPRDVSCNCSSFHCVHPVLPILGGDGKQDIPSSQNLSAEGRVASSATRILCILPGDSKPCVYLGSSLHGGHLSL